MKKVEWEPSNDGKNKRSTLAWLMSGLFGVLTGVCFVFGYQLEKMDHIDLADRNSLMILVCIIAVMAIDAIHVWEGYNNSKKGAKFLGFFNIKQLKEQSRREAKTEVTKKDFLVKWLILVLLCLPVLLAEFPGFFVYDAQEELNEVLTRSFSTHHPLLHVFLLGGVIALCHKLTGSWNIGIFAYIFLQMLVITAIFAYALCFLQKRGAGKKSRVLWLLYYGLFPTVVMFTLCSCKDGLFSALLLLLTVFLFQLIDDTEAFLSDKHKLAAFIVTAVLMPLFRHNGFYAYLVFVPFALLYFRKKLKKALIAMLVLPVVIYLVINTIIGNAFSREITHHQEMLTVPIMQLTRVYTYDRDSMTDEDISTLTSYIPKENLDLYSGRVSDLVKVGFNNQLYEEDSSSFWKLWFTYLKKKPMSYLNAWMLTCYGYVYPPANINVYKGTTVFTFTYDQSSYFGYEVELPGERHSLIPFIDSFYRYISIGSFHDDAPVAAIFLAPGLVLLLYVFVLFYRISIKNISGVLPFLPMLLCFCTVLLGPTYLVRYVVYFWFCLPLLAIDTSVKFD